MSRWNLGWLLGVAGVCFLGLTVSYSAPLHSRDKDYELVRLVVDVLGEVDQRYVRELDTEGKRRLVEDMINGGLERLDPHSSFINPRDYKLFTKESKGKFGGIGIQVHKDPLTHMLTVHTPLVGTPAYEAGVLAGDVIVKIDGKSTENLSLREAIDIIQGDPGQPITLSVVHEGSESHQPVDIKLLRAEIQVPSVLGDLRKANNDWEFMIDPQNRIGYIRLNQFTEKTASELRTVVEQLQKDGARGLVLDLRNNPGGLLVSAREVSDLFLTEGRIVSTRGRERDEETYDAKAEGTLLVPAESYPMAVLINRYSASASEIVAAALQDNHRAVIIGERSYGKGSVQNVIKMEQGASALKLTTASYWRPSGKNIHRFPDAKETDDWGVRPNDSGYRLTAASLKELGADRVPAAVLAKLKTFPEQRFATEKEYLDALAKLLSDEDVSQYREKIVEHADRGFEVPLKDRELIDYVTFRRDRDVITHKKPGAAVVQQASAKSNGKDKKPFTDRVLERALDYLRGEIKKAPTPTAELKVG